MDTIHKEIDNLFLENFIHNNFEKIYNSDEDKIDIYLLKTSKVNKNINVLNKSYGMEKKKPKFLDNLNENIKVKDKNENGYISNNLKIIRSIFKNKKINFFKNYKLDNSLEFNLKQNNLYNKNYINTKYISKFFKKFKNLNFLFTTIYNKHNNIYDSFLEDLKIHKRNLNYKNLDKKNSNLFNLNLIQKIKNEIFNLKKEKDELNKQNNNLILMNKKNFFKFKNNYFKNLFIEDFSNICNNENILKKAKIEELKCFKDNLNLKYKFHFKDEETKFLNNIFILEKINVKKKKILENIIKYKIKILIEFYKNIIFKNNDIKFYKNGIIFYLKELIDIDRNFSFALLDKFFNKIESKFIFLKLKIYIILNKKKDDLNDSNLSYKSIEKFDDNFEKKNLIPKIKTKLNKSFEIKTKKYFILNFKKPVKNKIKNKLMNINDSDYNFIKNTNENDLNINIYDLIILENKLNDSFINIQIKECKNNLENQNNKNKKEDINKLKFNLFNKLIKIFGINKTKNILGKKISSLSFDYNLYIKNNMI